MDSKTTVPKLIYIHIPKCAGTSMMQILKANYGAGFYRVGNGGGWRHFGKLPQAKRASITCLTGHMPWTMGQFVDWPKRYAVMLRNPVQRVASLFWFCRSFPKHRYHRQAAKMDLETFATIKPFADLDNGMTRWMAGRRDVGSLKSRGSLTDDDLRLAMAHTAASSVGFVETFEQDVRNWAREFGWTETPIAHKMSRDYPGPTRRERRVIAEQNRYDMALYEYALKKAT